MDVVLIQILAFMTVVFLVVGVQGALRGKRKEEAGDKGTEKWVFSFFAAEIDTIGRALEGGLARAFPQKTGMIRNDLIVASLSESLAVKDIRGLQGLACIALFVAALVMVTVATTNTFAAGVAAVVAGMIGWMYPTMWLSRTARTRQDQISKTLPFALDLLTVAMEAGQDFGAAVRFMVREGLKGPLAHEFSILLHQTGLGKSRVDALRAMADRVQIDELNSVVTGVIQSTEMGASIVETLKIQAEDIRRRRYHRAERKAARAPSIMLIPVAFFIVPAVFIIILTPIGIRMAETLRATR